MAKDIESLRGFAEALRRAPVAAMDAATDALNAAAEKARDDGIQQITKELNLEPVYVSKYLTVRQQARRTDLYSRIAAKVRPVLAPRYGAEQATTAATSSRASGDPYRGIPAGQKAAGSTAWGVKRGGNTAAWRNAFFIRGDVSNAWLMIARQGDGDIWGNDLKTIYGPSVSQAWKSVRDDVAPAAMALAQERFLERLEAEL